LLGPPQSGWSQPNQEIEKWAKEFCGHGEERAAAVASNKTPTNNKRAASLSKGQPDAKRSKSIGGVLSGGTSSQRKARYKEDQEDYGDESTWIKSWTGRRWAQTARGNYREGREGREKMKWNSSQGLQACVGLIPFGPSHT
jgi:hypothetical protein